MIIDSQTDLLFLADTLPRKYPVFYRSLELVLKECKIESKLLPGTKDVWAVDFMPIQVKENHFVQFLYDPDYLKPAKWRKTISDVDSVCEAINVKPLKSSIRLDGGNVIKSNQVVIMCDKVFRENPGVNQKQLISQLIELFEVERIIFVPQDKNDFTGHADGMVRFLDERTVLINDQSNEKPKIQAAFCMSLQNAGLDYIEIPYCPDYSSNDSAKGLYINYLQMKDTIVIPIFGIKEDDLVVRQFEEFFNGHTIYTVDSCEIAKQGGLLNCLSWNIKKGQMTWTE